MLAGTSKGKTRARNSKDKMRARDLRLKGQDSEDKMWARDSKRGQKTQKTK